jgi:A/G-specific adenine glycosylase
MTLTIEQGMRLTQTLQQALQTLSWVDDSAQNSLAKPKAMQLLASG